MPKKCARPGEKRYLRGIGDSNLPKVDGPDCRSSHPQHATGSRSQKTGSNEPDPAAISQIIETVLEISTRGGNHPKTSSSLPSRTRPSRRIHRHTYGIRDSHGIRDIHRTRICDKR
jgi:hypothetical protein